MTRKELYQAIKDVHIEEDIRKTYGRNFTQCTNAQLEEACRKWSKDSKKEHVVSSVAAPKDKLVVKEGSGMLTRLLETLKKKRILLNSEFEYILKG